jgi:hypothetical protein
LDAVFGIFATHLELFEALDKCGAGTVDVGVIAYERITFDRTGDVSAEKPLPRPCYRRNTSTACSTSTNRSSRPFMISARPAWCSAGWHW